MSNKKNSRDGLFRPQYTFLVAGGVLGGPGCPGEGQGVLKQDVLAIVSMGRLSESRVSMT